MLQPSKKKTQELKQKKRRRGIPKKRDAVRGNEDETFERHMK